MFCELVPWLIDVDVEELGEELCELLDDAELEDELLLCELDCGVELLLGDDVGVEDGGVELLLWEPDEEDDVELGGVDGGVELCELVGVEEDGDDEEDEEELELCELVDEEELLLCEPVLWLVCDEEELDD